MIRYHSETEPIWCHLEYFPWVPMKRHIFKYTSRFLSSFIGASYFMKIEQLLGDRMVELLMKFLQLRMGSMCSFTSANRRETMDASCRSWLDEP